MSPDRISATFSALADPTRRAILARLALGESSVTALAEPFAMSLPAISKHLKVLERAGLIARGRTAQWRPCRLEAAPLKDVAEWIGRYRRFWEASFDRLGDYLAELQAKERAMENDRELVITRVFDAPRDLVFKAWTDPAQARSWMGPRGFTATHLEGELRPGGAWRACLRRDDSGEELWQGGVWREIVEPERLGFTFAWDEASGRRGHETLVEVTFAEEGGKTTMSFRQAVFESVEQRDGHRGGWTSTFERLAEHLARGASPHPDPRPLAGEGVERMERS